MSAHTPGPWEVEGCRVYASGKSAKLVATCAWCPGQELANARLIAAAPELLKALKALVKAVETHDADSLRELLAAHAAIAKTTGSQS